MERPSRLGTAIAVARAGAALGTQLTHPPPLTSGAGRSPHRRVALGAAVISAALFLASCAAAPNGVQKESAFAIVNAAGQSLQSARTLEIQATSTTQGSEASLTFDIEGKNVGGGTFTSSTLSFQAEELHGIDYFRSKTLWSQVGGASLQSALGNRWVYIAASSSTAAELTQVFGSLTSPKALAQQLTKDAKSSVKGKGSRFEGQPVISVTEPHAGTIYVATTGAPYPLRWVEASTGYVDFRDFGKRFNITAPKGALNLQHLLTG